jgi:hypothetical protein
MVFADLDLTIKTLPDHRVSVFIRPPEELSSLDSTHKDTGTGKVIISSDVNRAMVDLMITLKKDGDKVFTKRFESISTINPIKIKLFPDDSGIVDSFEEEEVEEPIEEPVVEVVEAPVEEVVEEPVNENQASITGNVVDSGEESSFNFTIIYYIIGVVIVLAGLIFAVQTAMKKKGSPGGNIKIRKLGEKQVDSKRIEDAERKLEEAKKELDEIKNSKSKAQELREKIERDRKELEKLEDAS